MRMLVEPLFQPFSLPLTRGFQPFGRTSAIQSLTNAQKLSLPANTPVGTRVQVTDGFVQTGASDAITNQFYALDGGTHNGKPTYSSPDPTWLAQGYNPYQYDGTAWTAPDGSVASLGNETAPWLADWTDAGLTLTRPAVQQLIAPSTAQGGVFVLGGTQDGVWTLRESLIVNGKQVFVFLGDDGSESGRNNIKWYASLADEALTPVAAGFAIKSVDEVILYYSLSDVATPDLASNWKNAGDNSPASITVTSVTQGELDAGLKIGSDFYIVNGSSNGRNKYSDVLGIATDVTRNSTNWVRDVVTENAVGDTAFPWEADWTLVLITVERDDVASEQNWEVV